MIYEVWCPTTTRNRTPPGEPGCPKAALALGRARLT